MKPICVLQGPIETVSGYGAHTRDIALSLLRLGRYELMIVPTSWGACPKTALSDDCAEHKLLKSLFLTHNLDTKPDLHIQVTIPNEFAPQGKYNIGITAGIETDLCRPEWLEGLNKMNMNIVPSVHAKNVFLHSKYKKKNNQTNQETPIVNEKPIEVLFEGSDTKIYRQISEICESIDSKLSQIKEDFCFLFVGHWMQGDLGADRKDVGMLVKTFCETFSGIPNAPALILKSSGATFSEMDKNEVLGKIHNIRKNIDCCPQVYLIHGHLTDNEMNSLYNHPKVKAHVNISHGEGYGRPLQEASLSGKPVISSGWGGVVDFLDKEMAFLLPGEIKPVHQSSVNEWIVKDSKWYYCNYSVLSKCMVDIVNNYQPYLERAKKLTERNVSKFSLEAMDVEFARILDLHVPKFDEIVLPKLNKSSSEIVLPKLRNKSNYAK